MRASFRMKLHVRPLCGSSPGLAEPLSARRRRASSVHHPCFRQAARIGSVTVILGRVGNGGQREHAVAARVIVVVVPRHAIVVRSWAPIGWALWGQWANHAASSQETKFTGSSAQSRARLRGDALESAKAPVPFPPKHALLPALVPGEVQIASTGAGGLLCWNSPLDPPL